MADLGSEFVVTSSDVLHEGVTPDDHTRRPVGLHAAHRSQPRFQPSVIALDPVVRILRGVMNRVGHQLGDDVRQRGRTIGDDLDRLTMRVDRSSEEPAGRSDVGRRRRFTSKPSPSARDPSTQQCRIFSSTPSRAPR